MPLEMESKILKSLKKLKSDCICDKLPWFLLFMIPWDREDNKIQKPQREEGETMTWTCKQSPVRSCQCYLCARPAAPQLVQELHLQHHPGLQARGERQPRDDDTSAVHVGKVQPFAGLERQRLVFSTGFEVTFQSNSTVIGFFSPLN